MQKRIFNLYTKTPHRYFANLGINDFDIKAKPDKLNINVIHN